MRAVRAWGGIGGGAAAWLVGLSSLAVGAAPNLRYAKNIAPPTVDEEYLAAVALDSDVYAATRDGFPDLRVLDSAGRETAYILRPAAETRSTKIRNAWSARDPKVKLLEGDGLEITLLLADKDPTPHGMRLVTPLTNFEQRVRVFSSPDGEAWTPVLEDGVVFDYSQFMDVRSDALDFPGKFEVAGRHFRIVIDDVTSEQQSQLMELTRRLRGEDETDRSERVTIVRQPFRIDRIEFWNEEEKQSVSGNRRVDYPVKSAPAEQDAKNKQTIVPVTSRREPLTSLRVVTADRNFSRAARVEIERKRGAASAWEPLGSATVSRLDFGDLKRENLDISIPETREAALRVVIENRDSAPLQVTGVEARGTEYEAVFLASPTEKYRLAYGSARAEAPNYDTAAIAASLSADYEPVSAALGAQTELSPDEAPPVEPMLARVLNSPTFLTLAIALLVIALGFGLYRASRRLDDLPQ